MTASSQSETSLTLLQRIIGGDDLAWEEFSSRYVEVLRVWCRRWGVPQSDVDDLVQETFLIVISRVTHFERRGIGSLRAWRKETARRCWRNVQRRAERHHNVILLERFRRSRVALDSLESEFDRLSRHELLQTSMSIVQKQVAPNSWSAFRLLALEGLTGPEAAERLGMRVDSVYMAKMRVQKRIIQEFMALDGQGDDPA